MAVKTLGTNATTTLSAVQWPSTYAGGSISNTDFATIANDILNDAVPAGLLTNTIFPGAFVREGKLYVPNRGVLSIHPGDWIAVDTSTGWPILIGANTIPLTLTATGNTHTSITVDSLSSNVLNLGWRAGMIIKSSNSDIPAATQIKTIASNGLSLTLTAAATGTNTGGTMTVSNWTHT